MEFLNSEQVKKVGIVYIYHIQNFTILHDSTGKLCTM